LSCMLFYHAVNTSKTFLGGGTENDDDDASHSPSNSTQP
jgi:hypothetical protein